MSQEPILYKSFKMKQKTNLNLRFIFSSTKVRYLPKLRLTRQAYNKIIWELLKQNEIVLYVYFFLNDEVTNIMQIIVKSVFVKSCQLNEEKSMVIQFTTNLIEFTGNQKRTKNTKSYNSMSIKSIQFDDKKEEDFFFNDDIFIP